MSIGFSIFTSFALSCTSFSEPEDDWVHFVEPALCSCAMARCDKSISCTEMLKSPTLSLISLARVASPIDCSSADAINSPQSLRDRIDGLKVAIALLR